MLGSHPTSTAKSPGDTLRGLEAVASKLNPKDKVVDEEVELEDNMEHTAGSSSGVVPISPNPVLIFHTFYLVTLVSTELQGSPGNHNGKRSRTLMADI
ncbi:hypothetical protein UY3_13474 [Chelonia mydas]|uniref:Uncharacterized protein n=1 Tax=Chelonia mydas TaxID=8469 RepID=M7AVD8_CHEMY|nr:hypothetical protein UY3_13474 [Chelonia mydas]